MNRKSLFGRFADSTRTSREAERQEYFHARLEPLEDRKMLAVLIVSQSLTDLNGGALANGDPVEDANTLATGTYGSTAFGTLSGGTFVAGSEYIASAIREAGAADTVEIQPGTYEESDIVINKGIKLTGTGTKPVIVPQTSSANTTGDFPASTHSGIIVYSADVSIQNLIINGTGNSLTRDYHHGITTLYNAPGGFTLANPLVSGTDTFTALTEIDLGPVGSQGTLTNVPNLAIDGVEVNNTFWHGITVSPRTGRSFTTGDETKNLVVRNSKVTDVGDVKDADRVGILLQNISNQTSGAINLLIEELPNAYFNTISNVGVGLKTTSFGGPLGYGNDNGPNNGSATASNLVNQAAVYGFELRDNDSQVFLGNRANFSGANSATGIYIRNSESVTTGLYVSGYHIGMHVQEAWPEEPGQGQRYVRLALRTLITGPGTADTTSVGILVNNAGLTGTNDSTALLIGPADVTLFNTGIKILQETVATDGRKNRVYSLDANVSSNTIGVSVGNNSILEGTIRTVTGSPLVTSGNAQIIPKVFNYDRPGDAIYILNPSNSGSLIYAPDTADEFATSSVTLNSSATYRVQITGETASGVWQNFNDSVNYTSQLLGVPLNISAGVMTINVANNPVASGGDWGGDITQNGSGQLVIGGNATGGTGFSGLYRMFGSVNPSNSTQFLLSSTDFSNKTYINLNMRLDTSSPTAAEAFSFLLIDQRGNAALYPIPLPASLNTSTFTNIGINLRSPAIMLEGDHLDITNISGYALFGENGFLDLNGADVITRLTAEDFSWASLPASKLKSGGSIQLAGATLAGDVRDSFTPTTGAQFTIVDNTAAIATKVTGTFAGKAQGSTVTLDGLTFTIDYSGGDGNDVVLTKLSSGFSSTVTGRRTFYAGSEYENQISRQSAIATDKVAYIPNGSSSAGQANVTSYSKGLTGIMVELTGTHGTLTAADFTVKMSLEYADANNTAPSAWAAAPAFTLTTVPNTPSSGTDRYELVWADNVAPKNRYVEVIVEGNNALGGFNTNTGLAASDYFFFGNLVGESFNTSTNDGFFAVEPSDQIAARFNQGSYGDISFIENLYDFNRDFNVDPSDQIIARFNENFLVFLFTTNPPSAPEGGDGSESAVASALAAGGSSEGGSSDWVSDRLEGASAGGGPAAAAVAQLMESASQQAVGSGDSGADEASDDALLGSLLDDLA